MEQWAVALKHGNEIRFRRAEFKRELKAREARVSEVIEDVPEWLGTEHVGRLIRWIPRVGPRKMRLMLGELDIRELTRVGNLTRRQRLLLKMELERRGL